MIIAELLYLFLYAPRVTCSILTTFMTSLSFATFAIGSAPSAAYFGVASLVLFAVVGVIAGPNLEKMDPDAKK